MLVKSKVGMSFVLILFFVAAWLAVAAQSQETERTLQKITHKNEPVEIAEAKVGTRRVSLGQSFMANNDWVSGLSFKVKNLSAQAIVRIELELEFPEVTRNEEALILRISYGQVPGQEDSGPKEQGPVGPNETVEIAVGGEKYGGVKHILTDGGRTPGLVTKARIQFAMIIFADGTAWRNGFNLIRDPNNPGRYIRVGNN